MKNIPYNPRREALIEAGSLALFLAVFSAICGVVLALITWPTEK